MTSEVDPEVFQSLKGRRILKVGELVKQGHFRKNWRRRSFLLTECEVAYYGENRKVRGAIPLREIQDVRGVVDEDGIRNSFELRTVTGKDYTMIAGTEVEKEDWMRAIHTAMTGADAISFAVGEGSDSPSNAKDTTLKEDYARIVAAADAAGTAAKLETALEELVHFAEAGTAAHAVNTPLAEIMDECVRWVERLKRSKSGIWSASHEERTEVITRNARHILKAYDDFLASAAGAIVRGDKGAGDAAAEGEGSAVPPPRRRGVSFAAIGQGTSFIRHGTVCEPTSEPFASHYDVGEELGRGSYSVVRRAVHKRSQQECAVKIIDRAKLSKHDKEALENEVSIMCQLNHPNIVQLTSYYEEGHVCYLVTELVDGGELFDRIVDRKFYSERLARDLVRTLVETLGYCHRQGIVHRDLKPENILLASRTDDAQVKLADFGFARKISTGGLTTDCGSPWYVAPEILSGRAYGASVDLWSIGVITFILLCGYPPFHHNNQAILFRKIKSADYSFDPRYWGKISMEAKDLIRGLLKVDPRERFSVDQVLMHPWIKSATVPTSVLSGALSELRAFNASRRGNVIKQGFLTKQGHIMKNWKRRSFVLTPQSLAYYETENALRPRGSIELKDIVNVEEVAKPRRSSLSVFKITSRKGKHLLIEAGSDEERTEWMDTVQNARRGLELIEAAEMALEAGELEKAVKSVVEARRVAGMFRDSRLLSLWGQLSQRCERAGCRLWLRTAFEPAHSAKVTAVACSTGAGSAITSSWDNSVVLWDLENGTVRTHLRGHTDMVTDVKLVGDAGVAALSTSADRTLRLWDLRRGEMCQQLVGHTDTVTCAAVSDDGRWAVSGSWDKTVRLWDLEKGKCTKKMTGHAGSVTAVALCPSGTWCVSGAADHAVVLWDLSRGAMARVLKGHKGAVSSVTLSTDRTNILSTATDGTIRLWDVSRATLEGKAPPAAPRGKERGQLLKAGGVVEPHSGAVHCGTLSADGRWAFTAAEDCSLIMWDLDAAAPIRRVNTAEEAEFVHLTPDSGALLCTQGNNIEIWALDWSLRLPDGQVYEAVSTEGKEDLGATLARMPVVDADEGEAGNDSGSEGAAAAASGAAGGEGEAGPGAAATEEDGGEGGEDAPVAPAPGVAEGQ